MIDTERIKIFLDRFPLLPPVITTLNSAHIDWLIGGSGCLFLLGNERIPDDVDIFLPDESHDTVDTLFQITSYTYTSHIENVRNSNYQGSHSIQFTSHLTLNINEEKFPFSITKTVLENKKEEEYEERTLYLLPPEDVLLIKAIAQRGADVGKNDINDIQSFLRWYPDINKAYLQKRIEETNTKERVSTLFSS